VSRCSLLQATNIIAERRIEALAAYRTVGGDLTRPYVDAMQTFGVR
jgi:hypothetical protein